MQRVVVFDLETVPDLRSGRALFDLAATATDDDVRDQLGLKYARDGEDPRRAFVKICFHRIVCIGALYAERADRSDQFKVSRVGVGHIGIRSEAQLIDGFTESLNAPPGPQLVGFNSSSFDLPILRYRALANSIPTPGLYKANGRDYWYRFGRDHLDLCDILSSFGASSRPSLNEMAALCGIPGKAGDIDGSKVEDFVASGRIDEVANYCEADVLLTYLIFLRFFLAAGELSSDAYDMSVAQAKSFVLERLDKRPHLERFVR